MGAATCHAGCGLLAEGQRMETLVAGRHHAQRTGHHTTWRDGTTTAAWHGPLPPVDDGRGS